MKKPRYLPKPASTLEFLCWVKWPHGGYIVWDWNNHKWDHMTELPTEEK